VEGYIRYEDGRAEDITIPYLLAVPETSLRILSVSVALLAAGMLAARL
jgi:hypothetical protein